MNVLFDTVKRVLGIYNIIPFVTRSFRHI